jgi:hypothetical protein
MMKMKICKSTAGIQEKRNKEIADINIATRPRETQLRTHLRLWLWAGCVTQEVRKLRGDDNLMLFESLGIKPHFARTVAMHQNQGLILIQDSIPMNIMLAIRANLVRLATLPSVRAKIPTDFVFQLPFFGVGCACGDANFGMKETHLHQALIRRTAFPFLLFVTVLLAFLFLAAFAFGCGGNSWNSCNIAIGIREE